MSDHRETIQATGAPAAAGPYSHAVVSAGLLFCSGQTPIDPATGELVSGSIGEQAARCLENLSIVCAAAGTTLANAVRVSVYVTDMSTFKEVNEAYATFFEADPPARSTVGVAALPLGADVEMDAIVAL
jgi:2-iminobutanoate/2-iminopropanoate deaminase